MSVYLTEYKKYTLHCHIERSVLLDYNCLSGHNINYQSFRAIDESTSYYPRNIRESVEIVRYPDNFNIIVCFPVASRGRLCDSLQVNELKHFRFFEPNRSSTHTNQFFKLLKMITLVLHFIFLAIAQEILIPQQVNNQSLPDILLILL